MEEGRQTSVQLMSHTNTIGVDCLDVWSSCCLKQETEFKHSPCHSHVVELVPVIRPVHLSPETGWLSESLGGVVVSGHGSCSRSVPGLGVRVVSVGTDGLLLHCVSPDCLRLLHLCLLTFTEL